MPWQYPCTPGGRTDLRGSDHCPATGRCDNWLKRSGPDAEQKAAMEKEIVKLQQETVRDHKYLIHLYEDFVTGILTHAEYTEMKDGYEQKIKTATAQLQQLLEQREKLNTQLDSYIKLSNWLASLNGDVVLTGDLIERLVERIVVHSLQEISVHFKFKDEFDEVLEND